ncbi:hypothetical protein [Rhodococcus sp. P1Y]|uniref:hypothetical protein n=1 Tax=Rhodococcus sp. P1Y TaxID=1302308 RepID=UPI000EAF8CD1|nr:hypothetical protein [Rhodococcus sp. P1Y]AYJ51087.1 hypothetical protein D8W71_25490 [Rhodococcus sp. P1Y]
MKASSGNSARSALGVLGVLALAAFVVAAIFGYGTLAVIAGCICVVAVASAMGLVGGTHDRRTPHFR